MKNYLIFTTYLITLLLFFSLHFISFQAGHEIQVYKGDISFDGMGAYNYAYYLSKNFPHRHTGSDGNYKSFLWLKSTLESFGYEVKTQEFKEYLGDLVTARNLYAISNGSGEAIGILANFDMVPMSKEAASDTSGAVGILLQLAKEFKEEKHNRNLVFILVDSEEWGMQGAKYLIENYEGPPLKVVLVIEDLTIGNLVAIRLESMGQFKGYTPLWLRLICRDVAEYMNISFIDYYGFDEYVYRTIDISFTDQGPIIAKGIPSVEISTVGDNPELASSVYHAPGDVMENMKPETFQKYGEYVKRLIISLDKAEKIPTYDDSYLSISKDSYLPSTLTYVIPLILLIPSAFLLSLRKFEIRRFLHSISEILIYFLILLIPLALVYASPYLGLIPKYDTYPPPPKHPLLYQPNLILIILFFAIPILAILLLRKKILKYNSYEALLFSLLIAGVASIFFNRFGTVTLLSQALILWPLVPLIKRRSLRLILILAGLTIFLLLFVNFSIIIFLNPFLMIWYLILGIAYGQWSIIGNLLSLFVASILIYLIIHYFIRNEQI